ncbi:MAG: class II glutamine amidotransferase [Chlamydiia bacterium]|nr:class II glutamine amidotransferase [Chlamydiia bacterium]
MCRFVAYIGSKSILIKDLLETPSNSLIKQSKEAKHGHHGLNADGFGFAWYNKDIEPSPGIFKSIQPAWNDKNLLHLSRKIVSNCFLGHVRASTVGDVVFNNCHPFSYKEYSFVHNGTIRFFEKVHRALINELNDDFFEKLKSQTDSELIFFLIMQYLESDPNPSLEKALIKAFNRVIELQIDHDQDHFSRLNIVITNGSEMIATRFVSKDHDPLSLYYSTRGFFPSDSNAFESPYVLVASEPLNDLDHEWSEVPANSYLTISADFSCEIKAF